MKKQVKILNKNVERLLKTIKEGYVNHLDFEEDYEFLTHEEKQELFAVLTFAMNNVEIL